MKTLPAIILLGLALVCASHFAQAQTLPDPIFEYLYPPELVRMAQPALNLTEEQKSALQDAVNKVGAHLAQVKKAQEKETGRLVAMMQPDKLDSDAVMAQADKVMGLDQETKRASLALLLKIRETLTPEQLVKLREFKAKTAVFQARIRQAMDLAQQWKQDGRDLTGFEKAREKFEALMGEGDFKGAEALLDNAIKLLKQPPSEPKK